MKLIKQGFEILTPIDSPTIMRELERSTRLCYKSEDKIGPGTDDRLVASIIKRGHHAMLEHQSLRVRFVTDRGVTHELVRHRICAFAQESTRYCNYSDGKFDGQCTFIIPSWMGVVDEGAFNYAVGQIFNDPTVMHWWYAMLETEKHYLGMLEHGASAQEARSVLPNSLKTEIDVTANIREWRHILTLRTAKAAHPQMRNLMTPLLTHLKIELPVLFSDIGN